MHRYLLSCQRLAKYVMLYPYIVQPISSSVVFVVTLSIVGLLIGHVLTGSTAGRTEPCVVLDILHRVTNVPID